MTSASPGSPWMHGGGLMDALWRLEPEDRNTTSAGSWRGGLSGDGLMNLKLLHGEVLLLMEQSCSPRGPSTLSRLHSDRSSHLNWHHVESEAISRASLAERLHLNRANLDLKTVFVSFFSQTAAWLPERVAAVRISCCWSVGLIHSGSIFVQSCWRSGCREQTTSTCWCTKQRQTQRLKTWSAHRW